MERRSKRRARAFAEGKGKREEKSKRREVATKRWRGSTALFVVVDYLLVFCTRVLFTLKAGPVLFQSATSKSSHRPSINSSPATAVRGAPGARRDSSTCTNPHFSPSCSTDAAADVALALVAAAAVVVVVVPAGADAMTGGSAITSAILDKLDRRSSGSKGDSVATSTHLCSFRLQEEHINQDQHQSTEQVVALHSFGQNSAVTTEEMRHKSKGGAVCHQSEVHRIQLALYQPELLPR
ncbi:cyclic nucleotide-gated ion channel [Musa troglodytarum]|uniref:Cyclic nucleotide-gated ion channel n=1 Tax=Musa troglodytarum TaxID=320322 RepID=A0A9E7L4C8_9LILI|nr:cyclic nucleotide-gated ion channel [Musa troglodytarum]